MAATAKSLTKLQKHFVSSGIFFAVLLTSVPTTRADVLDPGDNMAPPLGSLILINYFGYMGGRNIYDDDADILGDLDLDLSYYALRIVYTFKNKLFGHTWGANAVIPLAKINFKPDFEHQHRDSGLGDIIAGPFFFLYENEKSGTYLSFWEFIYAPTGSWEKHEHVNLGIHRWAFQHQIAIGQYWKKFSIDVCLNYWQKLEEPDHDYKEPDAFEFESILAYHLTYKITLGFHFNWWKSLENAELDGHDIEDSKIDSIKIGGNVGYMINDRTGINLRYMHDVYAKNTWKGPWVYLRIYYFF